MLLTIIYNIKRIFVQTISIIFPNVDQVAENTLYFPKSPMTINTPIYTNITKKCNVLETYTINHKKMETSNQLNSFKHMRRVVFNRAFALIYSIAILTLLYHHAITIFYSTTIPSLLISLGILISDLVLAFMWTTTQSFRMRPIVRKEYLENLKNVVKNEQDFPSVDIFICTADPYKEPPIDVVNTALSVMAYDYPPEKISVYVSDDGGSKLTLFAFMESAKFAKHWLPYCRENNIMDRCPDAYFASNYPVTSYTEEIKMMYESMKSRVEAVLEMGKVPTEYITSEEEDRAFSKWEQDFTRLDHPTVIQVLLEIGTDKDIVGQSMPNLIYFSREKNKAFPHNFKAGALNSLLRVSAVMTNAPIILTLDCDMYSNDPTTIKRALCYIMDKSIQESLGWVQFPQIFNGINKTDIYGCEHKRLFQLDPPGMDGLIGASYVGTGCFFRRKVFFSGPSLFLEPELKELRPDHVVNKNVTRQSILDLAHHVAGCNYENQTNWGSKWVEDMALWWRTTIVVTNFTVMDGNQYFAILKGQHF
ncbi:hypothetical protein Leryth_021333 [Lithospermum erythrorhizon]|nr:hypothetical protein Leryth_021333 [Lithospermum erythrorhizon]